MVSLVPVPGARVGLQFGIEFPSTTARYHLPHRNTNHTTTASLFPVALTAVLLSGGIIGLFYPEIIISVANVILGIVVMCLNYPWKFMAILGPIFSNYWMRGILHLLIAVPAVISAPTTSAGLCLIACGLTYLVAAYGGESYKPPRSKRAVNP